MDRRRFLTRGAVAVAGLGAGGSAGGAEGARASGDVVREPARDVPVAEAVDVVVCGAGPAGIAAAVGAARAGAKVRLIEAHGQLGGIWTTGMLSWVLDADNKGGVMREITARIDERARFLGDVRWKGKGGIPYDVEQMKLVLEDVCRGAGVRIRLHTRVVAAVRDGARLTHCVCESKSGREAFAAKAFIDCTGDGDLAARAGCGFDLGRPAEGPGGEGPERAGEMQPMTLMCLVTGIDREATAAFHDRVGQPWGAPKDALFAEFKRAGVEPSYGKPTIFEIRPDLYAWMINHEYGYSGIDAGALTDATLHAREEVHHNIDALRLLGGIWQNVRIVATAAQIGVREGRRIHGRYRVTVEDAIAARRHEDAVCRVAFGIDVHSTSKAHSTGIEGGKVKSLTKPYDVPLRALIAKDADGLLMAGRCISGDFLAHSSYRVTGNSVAMGEAAGACAAVAAARGCLPHEVPWKDVAAGLAAPGA
ncbi:MAG: FAD-dependent oxidoreductase [Verrucomicrobiae bacterium]|nr:FAD-dependent oxidoreductase [Verrucomicrobiae bacterium]